MQADANTAHVASATDVATGPTLNLDKTDSLWHTRYIPQFAFCATRPRIMSSPRIFEFNIKDEVDRLFDESSKSSAQPAAVILMGGIATGKTTLRKQKYSRGYVLIDAGDMFLNLSRGEFLPFPGPLESAMEVVGRAATKRALSERRHIVTEIIGADQQLVHQLITSLQNLGYRVQIAQLTCPPEVAVNRNRTRNVEESISAYYSEPFHSRWISEASAELCTKPPAAR